MKTKLVETVTSDEENPRLRIYDGDIPLDAAGKELVRLMEHERIVTRDRVLSMLDMVWRAERRADEAASRGYANDREGLTGIISQALLEAHNAGRAEMREEAAGLCEKKASTHGWNYHLPSVGKWLATAIRSIT